MASNQSLSLSLWAALALTLVIAACLVTSTDPEVNQKAVGGVEPADLKDEEVQKAVDFAVETYNDLTNDTYVSKPIQVISVGQQVGPWARVVGCLSITVFSGIPYHSLIPLNCLNFCVSPRDNIHHCRWYKMNHNMNIFLLAAQTIF